MAQGVAIASLIVAAVGTGVGIHQQRKAENAREDADKMQQAQAELANQRSIRQSIAQSRLEQANMLSGAYASTGGVSSSGVQGALGAAQTQTGANIGFANQTMAANRGINDAISKYNQFSSNAATAGAVAALPGQFGWDVKSSAETLGMSPPKKSQAAATWP